MFYQRTSSTNNITIPSQLIELFEYYRNEIINTEYKIELNESSENYTITDKILNTKRSSKTFTETLFEYIDKSGLSDTETYKRATIDKRLFSKIKSNNQYHPSFGTVTLFALALELNTNEYENLLKSASYSLPQNSYANITLKYCFDNNIYDVIFVNNLMYEIVNKQIKDL